MSDVTWSDGVLLFFLGVKHFKEKGDCMTLLDLSMSRGDMKREKKTEPHLLLKQEVILLCLALEMDAVYKLHCYLTFQF